MKNQDCTCSWMHIPSNLLSPLDRTEGLYVWVTGEKEPYIDLVQGYSVTNWGHRHPHLIRTALEAINKVDHVTGVPDAIRDSLVRRLLSGVSLSKGDAYFDVGGAQIVRIALHVATLSTGRTKTACLEGSFHGHGCTGASLSQAFLAPNVQRRSCAESIVLQRESNASIARIQRGDLAAVLIEPIQGAAGFRTVSRDWLEEVTRACRVSGTLLISDEIQVGLGRVGSYSALRQIGLEADAYLFGKALGGGIFPISVILAKKGIIPDEMSDLNGLGSTFSENQVGLRLANAVLDLLDESLTDNLVMKRGQEFAKHLQSCVPDGNGIQVRSYGMAIAIDFESHKSAVDFWNAARSRRVLTYVSGEHRNIIKMFPPLNITQNSMDLVLELLTSSLLDSVNAVSINE